MAEFDLALHTVFNDTTKFGAYIVLFDKDSPERSGLGGSFQIMWRKQQEYGDDYIRTVVADQHGTIDRSATEPSWSLAIVTAQSRLWLLEAARNSESHFEAMFDSEDTLQAMESSMRHADAVRMLDRWIENRKDKIQALPAEQQEAALNKEYAQSRNQIVLSLDQLSTIATEHANGHRITSYDPSDDTPVRSITFRAPKPDLESFRKDHQFFLEPEQLKLLDTWIEITPQKSPSEFEREPIELETTGGGKLALYPGSNPDVLAAAELCYGRILDCAAVDKLNRWITDGYEFPGMDHDYRITLFHDGLARPQNFTELDLRDYEIDYVEFVVRHLGESDTEVLQRHRQRLDQYYGYLLQKQEIEVKRTPQSIQIPLNDKGRVLPLAPENDKGVLAAALELYSGNLSVSSKEVLKSWIEGSNQSIDLEKVRVYDKKYPLDYAEFSKFAIEELEEALSSDRHYISQADRAKVQDWVSLDFRVPQDGESHAPKSFPLLSRPNLQLVLHHKSGHQLLVSELQVQLAPEKFQDILNDPDWAMAKSNRVQIDRWLVLGKNKDENVITIQGDNYRRDSELHTLEAAAAGLVENNFEGVSASHLRILMTWIYQQKEQMQVTPNKILTKSDATTDPKEIASVHGSLSSVHRSNNHGDKAEFLSAADSLLSKIRTAQERMEMTSESMRNTRKRLHKLKSDIDKLDPDIPL